MIVTCNLRDFPDARLPTDSLHSIPTRSSPAAMPTPRLCLRLSAVTGRPCGIHLGERILAEFERLGLVQTAALIRPHQDSI